MEWKEERGVKRKGKEWNGKGIKEKLQDLCNVVRHIVDYMHVEVVWRGLKELSKSLSDSRS